MLRFIHYLKKNNSSIIILFLSFIVSHTYAMEQDDEELPLLQDHSYDNDVECEYKFPLEKLDPELAAHIFSFLPGNDPGLNYLIRLKGFETTTEPVQASPFYSVVGEINSTYADYIVYKCVKFTAWNRARYGEHVFSRCNTFYRELAESTVSFMATTRNKNVLLNFVPKLNCLIPHYNPNVVLDPQEINQFLEWYKKQISFRYERLKNYPYATPSKKEEAIYVAYHYANVHSEVLEILSSRLRKYPYFCNDRITDCASCKGYTADSKDISTGLVVCGSGLCCLSVLLCSMNASLPLAVFAWVAGAGCTVCPLCVHQGVVKVMNKKHEFNREKLLAVLTSLDEVKIKIMNQMQGKKKKEEVIMKRNFDVLLA